MEVGTTALVFLAMFVISMVAVATGDRPYANVEARINRAIRSTRRSSTTDDILAEIALGEDDQQSGTKGFAARRDRLMRLVSERLAGEGLGNRLAQRLRRADLKLQVAEFMLMVAGMGFGGMIIGWLMGRMLFGLFLGLIGVFAPFTYLGVRLSRRQRTLEGQLADVLVLISNSLRSGYSFMQAMDVVAREMPPPICREFEMVLRETRVNIPVEDALRNLVRRVNSADLDLAVTAMLIQRQVGGNMAEVIDKIAMTIRDRARLTAEVNAMTATGRLSGWVVAAVPAALVVLVSAINPDFMRPLFTHPIGWAALTVALIMQALGFFFISRIVNIKF